MGKCKCHRLLTHWAGIIASGKKSPQPRPRAYLVGAEDACNGVPVPTPPQPTEARSRRRRRRWVVVVDPGLTPRGDQSCLEPSMHSLAVPSRGLRLTCYRVGSVCSGPGTVQTGVKTT